MAGIYLLPENVAPADASRILDFLNQAQNAEEIAGAVEIPGELDIGLRVAARIIARREQLQGFTSLEQVYAVPYVGPERFTELVISLSSLRPPTTFEDQVDPALLSQIIRRLNALEEMLEAKPTIRLRAINADALLGQETLILAELKDAKGKPLIDTELTLFSTWGQLKGRARLMSAEGSSITVRSNHLGLCRVTLSAALGEALSVEESSSLSQALTLLGVPNDNPRDSLEGLTEFARIYRASGSVSLRRAIDVLFKHYGDSKNARAPVDSLTTWPQITPILVAWLTPGAHSATSDIPTALLQVRQRNWFYAWLWAYRELLANESLLGQSLSDISSGQRSGSGILTDAFGRIGSFVKAQPGLVGQQIGQTFAADALNNFLQTGLQNISKGERAKVVTGITSSVKSLGSQQAFATFEGRRTEFNTELNSRITAVDSSAQINELNSRVSAVETNSVTKNDLEATKTEILQQVSGDDLVLSTELRREFEDALREKADIGAVRDLSQQVDRISTQTQRIDNDVRQVDARVDQVNTRINRIGQGGPVRRR